MRNVGRVPTFERYFAVAGDPSAPDQALRLCTIRRACSRCYRDGETLDTIDIRLVSPRGTVHESRDYGETDCGLDATRLGWWWAL